MMSRTISSACSSSSARWSTTPERRACRSPPPSCSAVTSSADRGFDQGRSAEEDRALAPHDHALVAHRRHVRPTRRARAHDRGDLRDTARRQLRLVAEDAAEVLAVGEHLVLHRQEGATRVDEVDARQAVLERDLLRAQVLLHGEGEVGAALHRRVVGDHHDVAPVHETDAGDDPRGRSAAVVEPVGGERGDLEETGCLRRAGGRCGLVRGACRGPSGVPGRPRIPAGGAREGGAELDGEIALRGGGALGHRGRRADVRRPQAVRLRPPRGGFRGRGRCGGVRCCAHAAFRSGGRVVDSPVDFS